MGRHHRAWRHGDRTDDAAASRARTAPTSRARGGRGRGGARSREEARQSNGGRRGSGSQKNLSFVVRLLRFETNAGGRRRRRRRRRSAMVLARRVPSAQPHLAPPAPRGLVSAPAWRMRTAGSGDTQTELVSVWRNGACASSLPTSNPRRAVEFREILENTRKYSKYSKYSMSRSCPLVL